MLGFALGFVLLFRRFGLGATLGYLVAGAMVGPYVLGLVGNAEQMAGIAELGIVMLLFIVGLELAPARLWRLKSAIFGLGLSQVVLCGLAVTGLVWLAGTYPLAACFAIGLPLGLSSTAQVLPMLQSGGKLKTPFGERAFSILLFQDLSIIPLITIVAALGARGSEDSQPVWQLVAFTLLAIAGLILAGRFILRPLFRLIGGLGEREMFVVAGLFTVLASAAVMEAFGLSTALGAFIAGVMLADTPYRHELEADIEPFRSILLGMFFLAVGMMLDLGAVAERPGFVIGMAVALIATKTAIIFGLGMLLKMTWRAALALGLLLSQGGEFAFVLYTQAQGSGLLDVETTSLFSAIVTISMAATPFLMMATRRIRTEPKSEEEREKPQRDGASALVIGYGRFGQTVSQMLILGGIDVTLIDNKAEQIDLAEEFGAKVYFGDGKRIDLLRQAGAEEADIICFTIGKSPDEEFLESLEEAFPDAAIFLRVYDRRSLIELHEVPHTYAIRELMESAVQMGRAALEELGDNLEDVDKAERAYRDNDAERLDMQREEGSIYAGMDRTITQRTREERRDEAD
nr:cation:proton antiporter [Paraurantiacibacter namhicola]